MSVKTVCLPLIAFRFVSVLHNFFGISVLNHILFCDLEIFWGGANEVPGSRMWPVSRTVSNRVLQAVPTSCVPNMWQEGGMNSVPALVCLAARHFSLSNQTVRHE